MNSHVLHFVQITRHLWQVSALEGGDLAKVSRALCMLSTPTSCKCSPDWTESLIWCMPRAAKSSLASVLWNVNVFREFQVLCFNEWNEIVRFCDSTKISPSLLCDSRVIFEGAISLKSNTKMQLHSRWMQKMNLLISWRAGLRTMCPDTWSPLTRSVAYGSWWLASARSLLKQCREEQL
jgi:hypothetical protein